jgi:sigma-B regulation protein RsbU (phosphoserine phosphatase)
LLPGTFVTLAAGILDTVDHSFESILAGHHPWLVFSADGSTLVQAHGDSGMALGLMRGRTFSERLRPNVIHLAPGDRLLQYTDGLEETANESGEMFGVPRIAGSFLGHASASLATALARLNKQVRSYGVKIDDDLTSLAVRRIV